MVFEAALAAPAPDRSVILDRECGGDAELRHEVESLLNARTQAFVRTAGAAHAMADATTASTPREQTGEQIGLYKLLEPIGVGGFGSVWMAEQREPVKRRVALKIIKLGMDTKQVIARFGAELQALAMMDHPNIAKVFDAGATETGRPYFVMEYIKGVPILEFCDAGKLDTRARLELFSGVCHAIQHAHMKGIIHRDIKPSNVLVTMHDGVPVPKVIDFGIAKATSSELTARTLFTEHRQMIGTPAYMSPEQAEMSGLDIDTRSDIYSLGVLLYELLTGTTPFNSRDLLSKGFAEMMRIIREVEPDKPSTRLSFLGDTGTRTADQRHAGDTKKLGLILRGDLDWIVMKCLEKDRTRRYETANGLAADIKRHLRDEPVTAGPPGTGYRIRKFIKRNRARVMAASVVAGALVLAVIGTSSALVWALDEKTKATLAATSEAAAKVAAQDNEQRALAATKAAEASKEQEARARKRAETITAFVTTALRASDAQTSGFAGRTIGAVHDMTILAAMDNAVKDIDSGRFEDDPETEAALRSTIGVILLNNGKYDTAKPLLEQALTMRERLFAGDDPIVAESLNYLGELYFQQAEYTLAEPLLMRALAIREHARGPDHPDVAASINNLAVLFGVMGQYAQAEPLFTRALAIRERALGPNHTEVANGLSNLANLYRVLGQHARAEALHTRALAIREKALGPDHPEVANTLTNLASLWRDEGKYAQAKAYFARALAIYEKALGPDHPLVATGLKNLALIYQDQGELARAEPLFERSLAIDEKAYGSEHPSVAFTLIDLATLYQAKGQYAKAEPLFTRALAIHEKVLGPDHPDVAFDLNSLAALYQAKGENAQAEPLLRRALEIHERVLGPDHPDVATDLNRLAELYLAQSQYGEAEPLFVRALTIRESVLSLDHLDLALSLNNLAALYQTLGEYAQAEPLFVRALAIRERVLGPDHPYVAYGLNNLAMLYYTQHQYARAEPLYARALAINEKALGPVHTGVASSLNNLAALYHAQGEYNQAEPLFARAMAIFETTLGPNHPNVAQSLSGLARTHQALGKTLQARQGFDKAMATLRRQSPGGSPLLARVLWLSASARLENQDAAAALPELEEAIAMAEKFLKSEHPHLQEYRATLAKCREALDK